MRQLSPDSSLVRALNGGRKPWGQVEHLLADMWVVLVRILNPKSEITDHPKRIEMEAKGRAEAKKARSARLREKFEKRKRAYGLG